LRLTEVTAWRLARRGIILHLRGDESEVKGVVKVVAEALLLAEVHIEKFDVNLCGGCDTNRRVVGLDWKYLSATVRERDRWS
jgi:hypothetical protein